MNADGTATYTFTAATLAAAGQQVPTPVGTISSADVLIDVQGVADVKNVTVNGIAQDLKNGNNGHKGHKHHGHGHGKGHDKGKHKGDEHGHHGHHGDNDQDDD